MSNDPEIISLAFQGGDWLFDAAFMPRQIQKDDLLEILRSLEDCKEEGRAIYPEIFLTNDLHHGIFAASSELVLCGEILEPDGRMRRALKRCLPIAGGAWMVVLEVSKDTLKYGVARSSRRIGAPSFVDEFFAGIENPSPIAVMHLARLGNRAIRIRTSQWTKIVSLTLSSELLEQRNHIEIFAQAATANLIDPNQFHQAPPEEAPSDEQLKAWEQAQIKIKAEIERNQKSQREYTARIIEKVIEQACREGHGLLVAVVSRKDAENAITTFSEGAYLKKELSLLAPDPRVLEASGSDHLDSELGARADLATKMIECDLLTLFSEDGHILGYNIHVPNTGGGPQIGGGARTRAFIKLNEAPFIKAAMMGSQDGQTRIYLKKDA